MSDLSEYWSADSARKLAISLGYAALAAAIFIAFLVAYFPYGDALSSALAPAGVKLDYRDQHWSFPFGARLDGVHIRYAQPAGGSLVIESRDVSLMPALGALLLGRPGLRIRADFCRGIVHAVVTRHGGATEVNFDLDSVELARCPVLNLPGLAGRISGTGSIEIDGANALDGSGILSASGSKLALPINPAFPALRFDTARGRLRFDHGLLSIDRLEGHGGDAALSAHGTIRLAQPLPQSTVDMNVTLDPTPVGRQRFGMLLGLLPHPPGSRPYVLRGPLAFPSVN